MILIILKIMFTHTSSDSLSIRGQSAARSYWGTATTATALASAGLVGWLAGWLAFCLCGWLAGRLSVCLAGWQVGWLAGWLAGWPAGQLAG